MKNPESFKMPFGKYCGRTLDQIADEDIEYIRWLNNLDDLRGTVRDAVDSFVEINSREFEEGE